MDIKTASTIFGITERRVEKLSKEGRIPGARMEGGAWVIPDDAEKPKDLRVRRDTGEKELARRLSISSATVRNWIRLGKIKPDREDGTFSPAHIEKIAKDIESGAIDRLRSRRNKKALRGKFLYKGYCANAGSEKACEELLSHQDAFLDEDISFILASIASTLYFDKIGKEVEDSSALRTFLFSEKESPLYPLVTDLLGSKAIKRADETRLSKLIPHFSYRPFEDTLGLVYMSLSDMGEKKVRGAYYTPRSTCNILIGNLRDLGLLGSEKDMLDPASGTGNFMLSLLEEGEKAEHLYCSDIDGMSIKIARVNVALSVDDVDVDMLKKHIMSADSLLYENKKKWDVVLGNPPWGSIFAPSYKETLSHMFRTAESRSLDASDVFTEKAIDMLEDGGTLSFILPESLLTVASHKVLRSLILENMSFSSVMWLGNVFALVECPSVILSLKKRPGGSTTGCRIEKDGERFVISSDRRFTPERFLLSSTDEEWRTLESISNVSSPHYLKDNAVFALGVVTGDNSHYVKTEMAPGYETILRGADIERFRTGGGGRYIKWEPERFQQKAKEEIYRAKEKILYRFISSPPVFAYDGDARLSLNSCNIMIPDIRGLSIKYILAVLNSRAASFFFMLSFSSVKVLRAHIEALPIPNPSMKKEAHIVSLVDKMIKGEGDAASLYEAIDSEIMELYALDEEERKTILTFMEGKNLFLPE